MELHKGLSAKILLCLVFLSLNSVKGVLSDNTYATTQISSSECFDTFGMARVSVFIICGA